MPIKYKYHLPLEPYLEYNSQIGKIQKERTTEYQRVIFMAHN
jgi:hypothetical protein